MDKYTVSPYQPGDEDAILALHNRSFSGHASRPNRHWTWKFLENPLGRTEIMLAKEKDGRCVGVYAGVTHPIILDNAPCLAGNHIDVAIDEKLRQGMAGARLLLDLGRRYFATYAGGDTKLTWGFPEPALHRLGLRLIKFEVLRDVVFLVRKPDLPVTIPEEIEVQAVKTFGEEVDALWRQCSSEVGTGTVRDARYLNWRYAAHPEVAHVLLEARDRKNETLRGVTVLREGGWDPLILSMVDWLAPLDDRAAETALIQYALGETARRRKHYLICWFPVPRIQFTRFQIDHAFFAQATPYQECFRAFTKGLDRRWLDQHWYQTMGDIDFF
jgi:hypothetical protein